MSEEQGIFQPTEMEIDRSSKLSLLEHISYRLRLPDRLDHSDNGHLDGGQMLELTKAVISESEGYDSTDLKAMNQHLKHLYQKMLDQKEIRMSFITSKKIGKMSKTELGQVIAACQDFAFEGDHHIGERNGVVSRHFMEEILDSLSIPGETKVELTKENFKEIGRPDIEIRSASSVNDLIGMPEKKDWSEDSAHDVAIVVPDYQRSNQNWNRQKKVALVDSILKDIPMPTIVLGRTGDDQPWQLVDGQQRLINYKRFLDEGDFHNFTFHGRIFSELEPWMQTRINDYRWNVEHITANSDRELALLYERYNSSGKTMSPVQIRLARFHEVSALHHFLLAMAGGPKLDYRDSTRMKLGVGNGNGSEELDEIERLAKRAKDIRKELPRIGEPTKDERRQVRQVTEKTYDILCRIVGYSVYRSLPDKPPNDFPTAKAALDAVLPHYKHGSKATEVADRLDLVIRKVSSVFGEFAFTNLRLPKKAEPDQEIRYLPVASVHGWVAQVQCASFWNRSDEDLNILEANPDPIKEAWYDFAVRSPNEDGSEGGIVHMRQNSLTIWDMQERWISKVDGLIDQLGAKKRSKKMEKELEDLEKLARKIADMPEDGRDPEDIMAMLRRRGELLSRFRD